MVGKISIKDILEQKGCSMEEFIRLASEKGITLSNGEGVNYLSQSLEQLILSLLINCVIGSRRVSLRFSIPTPLLITR